jgi:hypothetical protein
MRWTIFWVIALPAAVWNLYGIYDLTQSLSGNREHLEMVGQDMAEMIAGYPVWRKAIWGLAVATSVLGSFALLLRRAMAEPLFWATAMLMLIGFAYDLGFAAGAAAYGKFGLVFVAFLVAIEAMLALYARWAARQGMLRRP